MNVTRVVAVVSLLSAGALVALLSGPGVPVSAAPASNPPTPATATPSAEMAKVQAFVANHCLDCHDAETKKADLALDAFKDELSLLKNRKMWDRVLEMVHTGEMPPKRKARPKLEEAEAFAAAVQGIFKRADAASLAKPDPGHITVRRLNRTEYNNTIRDLCFVDFSPAEDFPSDDIGHGFDNIGDVLTLSPVLMERYLAAAESITQRAVLVDLPKSPERWQGGKYLEPAGKDVPQDRFRPLSDKGPLHTLHTLHEEGEYILKARVYAELPDGEPAKMAFVTADAPEERRRNSPPPEYKQAAAFDIKTTDSKKAEWIETKLTLQPGRMRVGISLLNPKEDRKRVLRVETIVLIGPLDTRPKSHRTLLARDESKPKAEQTRTVLERFATRAYRRPATKEEVDRLVQLADQVEKAGGKWEAAIQYAMQAVLISPKFLFRLELDSRPESNEPKPLGEYQLASRLSYFIWSSMPDPELLDLAAKGQLRANLDKQVQRMLKDDRAKSLVDNFAMQWLQLRRLKSFAPDTKMFPNFDERLRASMQKETELFIAAIIKEDRSILDLIDADFTFLDERLARHYGIADTNGNWMYQKADRPKGEQIPRSEFVRVSLQPNGPRGGLLTQASVLTVTSNPTRTSPVKRGKFVLEQILGTPPPPPPPEVPELEDDGKAIAAGSLRKRLEEHRANPACANCHAKMDPMGFAFENFDAVGAFRTKDGNFEIDPSGMLEGKTIKGPADVRSILKEKKVLFARCLTEELLTYALGRGLEYYDQPTVDRIVAALSRDGYKFSTLAVEIARSTPFTMRRGKETAE